MLMGRSWPVVIGQPGSLNKTQVENAPRFFHPEFDGGAGWTTVTCPPASAIGRLPPVGPATTRLSATLHKTTDKIHHAGPPFYSHRCPRLASPRRKTLIIQPYTS